MSVITLTPENRRRVALVVMRGRLKLELLGMTSRTSTIKAARGWGFTGRTKAEALAWVEQELSQYNNGDLS